MGEEVASHGVWRDERVHGGLDPVQSIEAPDRKCLDLGQPHAVAGTECGRIDQRLPQLLDKLLLVANRRFAALARSVDGQGPLERGEDVGVVDDEAVVLAREYPVGTGDRLHERVVPHRLVEVDRRAARHVEPGHPHGAHEDEAQRVAGSLNCSSKAGCARSSACGAARCRDPLLHLLDLVLTWRNDDRHVGGDEDIEAMLELRDAPVALRLLGCPSPLRGR